MEQRQQRGEAAPRHRTRERRHILVLQYCTALHCSYRPIWTVNSVAVTNSTHTCCVPGDVKDGDGGRVQTLHARRHLQHEREPVLRVRPALEAVSGARSLEAHGARRLQVRRLRAHRTPLSELPGDPVLVVSSPHELCLDNFIFE